MRPKPRNVSSGDSGLIMILIIDNYDSFTYNLVQMVGALCPDMPMRVVRNNAITVSEINQSGIEKLMISPGPCTPNEAGISVEVVEQLRHDIPILGVCLGHQCIAQAFGVRVRGASEIVHGKAREIFHQQCGLFARLPNPFFAARYHSLAVERSTLPSELQVTAWTVDGEVMAIEHTSRPVFGVQFHPESFLTPHGSRLMRNFLEFKSAVLCQQSHA